jgi:hypothetical protein
MWLLVSRGEREIESKGERGGRERMDGLMDLPVWMDLLLV